MKQEDTMEFTAQIQGFKTLASGGARLTIDVFDTTPAKDLAGLTLLAMGQTVVTVALTESPVARQDGP